MWDGLFVLLGLSSLMALASFLAGSLPLSVSLSHRQLRLISAIGTGVLVGTALIVIIPEGIETLYSSSSSAVAIASSKEVSSHGHAVVTVDTPGIGVDEPDRGGRVIHGLHGLPSHADGSMKDEARSRDLLDELLSPSDQFDKRRATTAHDDHKSEPAEPAHHAYIGLALIAGFILMYLIDAIPPLLHTSSKARHVSLHDLSNRPTPTTPQNPFDTNNTASSSRKQSSSSSSIAGNSTTIGLVIHATADGIALGASTASPETRTSLGLIVFLAIMLHKAPAAFSLTALLLKQGLSTRLARTHLLVFSFAAPLGALLTWIFVNVLGTTDTESGVGGHMWWTGVVLIFSGGTFLYVAMHAMSVITGGHGGHGVGDGDEEEEGGMMLNGNRSFGGSASSRDYESGRDGIMQVGLVVVGMLVPLVTQIGHSHAH